MPDSIIPAHIFYDPQIIETDLICKMATLLNSDTEISRGVHLELVSMSSIQGLDFLDSVLPITSGCQIDLRAALELLVSQYESFDANGVGTRDREVIFLFGSFPVDDWLEGIGNLPFYFPLIIAYWFSKENLSDFSRRKVKKFLNSISLADSVTGAPRNKIYEIEDQGIPLVMQDVFMKLKTRLLDKVRTKPSFFRKN